MDDVDRRTVAVVGAHSFVLPGQLEQFLGVGSGQTADRLRALDAARLIRVERLRPGPPPLVRATRSGLEAIGSRLPAPALRGVGLRHEAIVVSLWLSGHAPGRSPRTLPPAIPCSSSSTACEPGEYADLSTATTPFRTTFHHEVGMRARWA